MPPPATPAEPGSAACVWSQWDEGTSRLHAGLAWLEQGKLCQLQYRAYTLTDVGFMGKQAIQLD